MPPNLFWKLIDIFEAEKRRANQEILFEPRFIGASCIARTAEKMENPKKDLRLPFSLVRFFWASKRNEQETHYRNNLSTHLQGQIKIIRLRSCAGDMHSYFLKYQIRRLFFYIPFYHNVTLCEGSVSLNQKTSVTPFDFY